MKKKILLITMLVLLGSIKVNAFTVAQIQVQVNNSQTGLSIASHPVIITDSAGFNQTYYTNAYGQCNDSIYNAATTPVKYYIITYDCNNVMHYDTVTTFGWVYKSANFNICNVGADLGIIGIIIPGDTSFITGFYYSPCVKVKNYSTSIVNSFHIGYSINGQAPVIYNWYGGSIMYGDTLTISMPYFVMPTTNFTFCAFLMNTDNNYANDTLCKTVVIANPYNDAGVVEVLTPLNSVIAGDSVAPVIKFKNYGTNTLTSVNIGYRPKDWGPFVIETWTGNLPYDSTAIFAFNQKFQVQSTFDLRIEVYTFLTGDQNWHNDSVLKILPITPVNYDAGVVDIVIPSSSIHVGDTVYPRIILKNYGLNTLTNIEVKVKINQQNPYTYTWSGTLPYNGIDTLFIGNINVIYIPDMNFKAFTNLNNDQNHNNDTSYRSFTILPPLNDVGLVQVLHPVTALTGDTIYPQIKIKNFGSSPVSSVSVRYRVNGQQIGNAICNLNIAPDSSVIFTFPQYFICPSTTVYLVAYIQATNIFVQNDSAIIWITPNPAVKDAGIIEIINPGNYACVGSQIITKVIIKNFGQTPLSSIPIAYQRGSLTPVTAIWTGSPLNYGDTVSYTFNTTFVVPMGSTFSIAAYTNLANDGYSLNNKKAKSIAIINIPPAFNILGDSIIVAGQSNVMYYAGSSQYGQYVWTLPPGAYLDSINQNFIIVHFANNAQSGNITCKIINPCGVTPIAVFPVNVYTTPPPPIINLNANHTLHSSYSTGNQWYFENNAIQGANSQTYTATQTGHYYCMVSINGITSAQSNTIYVGFTGLDEAFVKTDFEVYPNPASDKLFFRYAIDKTDVVELKLMDIEGRCIKSILNIQQKAGDYKYEIDVSDMTKGLYFYQFNCGNSALTGKIIITK